MDLDSFGWLTMLRQDYKDRLFDLVSKKHLGKEGFNRRYLEDLNYHSIFAPSELSDLCMTDRRNSRRFADCCYIVLVLWELLKTVVV